ncbi:MAG: RNA-directed DNA polymerase [Rhodanobacter sp.]|nr:MAG: RNA-directed DNA polymerase [Rhodanobacter sp.]
MNHTAAQPKYTSSPVRSLAALSRSLGLSVAELQRIGDAASSLYRDAKPIIKVDGSIRRTFDAFPVLKNIHRRLQTQFFQRVVFPDYLTGSLKGRDARRNAALHTGAAIVVTEDIKNFFPSTDAKVVYSIWANFFRFAPEVARLLTALTVKDGALPQGAITSSYLANLAFWDREWRLYENLRDKGISYSRYVDDVTFSSKEKLSNERIGCCIAGVYGLMAAKGLKAKRSKHEIRRGNGRMLTTKLMVNTRPALMTRERQNIRAAVHQLEVLSRWNSTDSVSFKSEFSRVSGRVGRLSQLHPMEGAALRARLATLRAGLYANQQLGRQLSQFAGVTLDCVI